MTDFADLEDPNEWRDAPPASKPIDTTAQRITRQVSGGAIESGTDTGATFTEPCTACRGSGNFVSYTGRIVGECFKCHGKGERTFKTSAEARKLSRASAAKRRVSKADAHAATAAEFLADNPAIADFLGQSWGFPESLSAALVKYGSLTPGQLAACDKCIASQADKAAARADSLTGLDLTGLPSGRYAVPDGDTRLKIHVNVVTSGKWAGWIFVNDAAEYGHQQKYGAQRPGENYGGKVADALKVIAEDPRAASIAYGKLVGVCGVCNAKLENPVSVAAGIGPVCAAKFGA